MSCEFAWTNYIEVIKSQILQLIIYKLISYSLYRRKKREKKNPPWWKFCIQILTIFFSKNIPNNQLSDNSYLILNIIHKKEKKRKKLLVKIFHTNPHKKVKFKHLSKESIFNQIYQKTFHTSFHFPKKHLQTFWFLTIHQPFISWLFF